MKYINQTRLTIPCKSINESFARAAVAAFAAQLDPTIEEINDIKTAVSEAVTNAIVHAYPEEMGTIRITVSLFEGGLDVTVRDSGCGITDIKKAMEPLFTTGGTAVRMRKSIMPRAGVRLG